MTRTLAALAGAGLAILVLVVGLRSAEPGSAASTDAPLGVPEDGRGAADALGAEVARLRDALRLEQALRQQLAAEVAALRERVGEMAALDPGAPVSAGAPAAAPSLDEAARAPSPSLDEAALLRAGFDPADVRSLRSELDAVALEQLYLRDRAEREGWLGSPRFAQENAALADRLEFLRDESGDALYDWFLYASGRPNRVRVVEVMEGSAAALAGLDAGDAILRYDGRTVFSMAELREGTRAGTAGETTPVDVVRDGRERRIYVPRGPLGVRIAPVAEEPPPVR